WDRDDGGGGGVDRNAPPTAEDRRVATMCGEPVRVELSGEDPEGATLTYQIVAPPQHGALGSLAGAFVVYTPAPGFHGADRFTYSASDGVSASAPATITVVVDE